MTIEEKAIEYANKKVPNPSASVAPYYTTADMWEDSKQDYIQGAKYYEKEYEERIYPKWIVTQERMPEVGRDYLVYLEGYIAMANFYIANKSKLAVWSIETQFLEDHRSIENTYYMPLPDRPVW